MATYDQVWSVLTQKLDALWQSRPSFPTMSSTAGQTLPLICTSSPFGCDPRPSLNSQQYQALKEACVLPAQSGGPGTRCAQQFCAQFRTPNGLLNSGNVSRLISVLDCIKSRPLQTSGFAIASSCVLGGLYYLLTMNDVIMSPLRSMFNNLRSVPQSIHSSIDNWWSADGAANDEQAMIRRGPGRPQGSRNGPPPCYAPHGMDLRGCPFR